MAERAGGYYGEAFKGNRGVTEGDLLSPTIFNIVADAVVRHWVVVMMEVAEEQGERVQESRHQNALFCADDGMVALLDPRWIQDSCSTLVSLFDSLGQQINFGGKSGMICRPC